jgi:hypothetical protein
MTFLDRARAATAKHGPVCTVRLLLESVPKDYASEVNAAILDRSIPGTTIAVLLTQDDHPVKPEAVRRHRNRLLGSGGDACLCPVA